MAYIGNSYEQQLTTPTVDYFSGNGVLTTFTLTRPVLSTVGAEVVVNNVPQNPSSAYSIAGNQVVFTSAPSSGVNNIYVRYNPLVSNLAVPGQGTIQPSALSYPNALSWDANGDVTAIDDLTVTRNLIVNGSVIVNSPFIQNAKTISASLTLSTTTNYMSAGPITINDGVTVTLPDGAVWTIV
jgi:hypothetical protein